MKLTVLAMVKPVAIALPAVANASRNGQVNPVSGSYALAMRTATTMAPRMATNLVLVGGIHLAIVPVMMVGAERHVNSKFVSQMKIVVVTERHLETSQIVLACALKASLATVVNLPCVQGLRIAMAMEWPTRREKKVVNVSAMLDGRDPHVTRNCAWQQKTALHEAMSPAFDLTAIVNVLKGLLEISARR